MTSEKILYNITDKTSDNLFYHGISYYKNYIYATNGALFAKIKYEIPKEYKGKTVLSDNSIIDMDKRSYAIITSKAEEYLKNKERDTIDISKLSDYINSFSNLNAYLKTPILYIRLSDNIYRIDKLKTLACIAYELFLFNGGVSLVNNVHALVIKDSDNLLMCACTNKTINDVSYIDYKTGKLKNFDYTEVYKSIKSDISKLNRLKKKSKTNKDIKNIDNEISKLNGYKTFLDDILNR